MTSLPVAGYFTGSGRKNSEGKQGFDLMLAVIRELVGGEATTQMTIAAGSIAPTVATHTVDTEADAAADNLDNILQASLPGGRHLILFPEDVARVVTLRHNQGGAGEILLVGGANFALDTADSWIWLRGVGTTWKEFQRSGAAPLKNKLDATTAPGLTDDSNAGFSEGSLWIDVTGDQAYRCVDDAVAAAVWIKTTLSTSDLGALALLATVGTAQIDNNSVTPTKLTKPDHAIIAAAGDETTIITTGSAKITFRMPYAMTLSGVRASLTTVSSSGLVTVDINQNGTTILSTKLTIDASEKTSETAATAAVISDTTLDDDVEITIDIDGAGSGAKGLKVSLIGKHS